MSGRRLEQPPVVLCLQTLDGGQQVGDHVGVVSGDIVLAQGQEAIVNCKRSASCRPHPLRQTPSRQSRGHRPQYLISKSGKRKRYVFAQFWKTH